MSTSSSSSSEYRRQRRQHQINLKMSRAESIDGSDTSSHYRHSFVYVPRKRFSRYFPALSGLAFVRFKRTIGSELPLDTIGLFSNVSFRWLNEYLYAGYANGMKDKTLPSLSQKETCNVNEPRLENLLRTQFVKNGQTGASIPKVAWRFVRTRVLIASLIYLAGILFSLGGPIFVLREIIRATEERNDLNTALSFVNKSLITIQLTANNTYKETMRMNERRLVTDDMIIFARTLLLIFIEVVSQFLIAWSSYMNLRTACRLRSACLAIAYKKLLGSSLGCSTRAQQTLTYFVPDSEILYELIGLGPLALSGPCVLVIIAAFTWLTLGVWALVGVLVIVLFYSSLLVVAHYTKSFAARAIEYSLRRMSLVEELIKNIQLAKISLWDRHFQEKIKNLRRRELSEMQFGGFSEGCGLSLVHMIPVVAVSTITLFSMHFEQKISFVRYVPVAVLFLVNLKHCIWTSWMGLSSITRGLAFLNKLKSILILQEPNRFIERPRDREFALIIHNGHFTWWNGQIKNEMAISKRSRFSMEKDDFVDLSVPSSLVMTLSEIDFYVAKGKIVGIYGHKDSGKTSLLLSILGQLRCVSGTVTIRGTCSYVPAEPWLMEGTIKENILFGAPFDSSRYSRVLLSSQLQGDIAALAALDDTDIALAEFGPVQRQKVGLARAVYAQRDINLLDEPLASLEHRECIEVFESCVQHLTSKAIIVASDRIELLSRCDIIYVLQKGTVLETAKHDDLMEFNPQYAESANLQSQIINLKLKNEELMGSSPSRLTPSSPKELLMTNSFDSIDNYNENEDAQSPYGRSLEFPVLHSFSEGTPKTSLKVYLNYTGGWIGCAIVCFLATLYAFSIAVSPVCIVYVEMKNIDDVKAASRLLAMQVGFMITCGVILMCTYNKIIFVAAKKMHDYWIGSLVRAQISIFSTATISLLLSICSLNLQEVDLVLPRAIMTVLVNVGISSFSLIILWQLSPWLIFPAFCFVVISVIFSIYVRGAVLSFHELKVTSATLVLNHIRNTVQGRATIQAFSNEKAFIKKYYKLFDENSTYDFMLYATRLWLEFRLKLLSILVLSAVIFMSELLYTESHGLPRFCLAYLCTLQLTLGTLHAVSAINNVYTSLMALNSVDHYMKNIPKEREGTARLPRMWPTDGSIEFRNVLFYDREESCRKPLSFSASCGDKIAVISSKTDVKMAFVSALYRFLDLPAGEIFINSTNISQVPLKKLRRCISFIPANPLLFNGTLRHNLDPSEVMTDQALMKVLQDVFLWGKVSRLPEKLVSDSCHLFTVYERVLIFLARALLNDNTKIIIIEEPQAAVAKDRFHILETVLENAFGDYTVIRLCSQNNNSRYKSLYLDDEEDFYSDQGSSNLSQQTAMTEIFTAQPANVLSDNYIPKPV